MWDALHQPDPVVSLGAVTGNQAVQMVQAGLKAIYASGWQVAADAEAGFGGVLNAFELMKQLIEAGAAAVHFEDQLSSAKKCGHMGGKVVIPIEEFIKKLIAARLAADVCGVSALIIARTDALSAKYIANDIDLRDQPFIVRERTPEGFYKMKGGMDAVVARGLAYAPYADLLWFETSSPDLKEAQTFANSIHKQFPGKLLAYNCSPSFNWEKKLDAKTIAGFQQELSNCGYKFQFVTLAGFHCLNHGMFELASEYKRTGMSAYALFQRGEFAAESKGYGAVKHQEFVGTGYFDLVASIISSGQSSTLALPDSTEKAQF